MHNSINLFKIVRTYHYVCYVVTSCLCLFMVVWILGLPASWRAGWQWHDTLTQYWYDNILRSGSHFPTPLHLVTKYKGHSIAQFAHVLPGALWAGLVPFQLHPSARKRYRRWHRRFGYCFVAVSYLMTAGFMYIDRMGLVYIHADFPRIKAEHNTTWLPFNVPHEPLFRLVSGWFVLTITMAVWYATRGRFHNHRIWILRHVGSGIWISVQRLVVIMVNAKKPENQKKTFGDGALVGVLLTCIAAEMAVWGYIYLQRYEEDRRKAK